MSQPFEKTVWSLMRKIRIPRIKYMGAVGDLLLGSGVWLEVGRGVNEKGNSPPLHSLSLYPLLPNCLYVNSCAPLELAAITFLALKPANHGLNSPKTINPNTLLLLQV